MKKRGFTLVELLAVIIILAIIALIATPIVMGIIENSKKASAKIGAGNYVRQVETQIIASKLKEIQVNNGVYTLNSNGDICLNNTCSEMLLITMNGTKPSGGKLKIENEKVIGYDITIGEYKNKYGSVSRTPRDYQEVEYIQNQSDDSGLSYLVIDLSGMNIKKAIFEYGFYYYTSDPNAYHPMLFSLSNDGSYYSSYICLNNYSLGGITISPTATINENEFDYDIEEREITNIPEANYMRTSWSDRIWTPIGKFKSIKLYNDSGDLKIDLIPCYRKSDNEPGMYDIINNEFYTNAGTGTFDIGNDV